MFIEALESLLGCKRHPATKDWKIFSSPSLFVMLLVAYVASVKWIGPRWMRDKKPYKIKSIIFCYNAFQIITNAYLGVKIFYLCFVRERYSPFCQPITYHMNEDVAELYATFYLYFFVRLTDFMDTFFFVLTKKFNHITFLHVCHHTMVAFNGWLYFQFTPGGQTIFPLLMNMAIHSIMYTYYFLAAFGPKMQKYLWWKRYLTRLQIWQFIIGMCHGCIPLFVDCGIPKALIFFAMPQATVILLLFINFYAKNYEKKILPSLAQLKLPEGTCYGQVKLRSE